MISLYMNLGTESFWNKRITMAKMWIEFKCLSIDEQIWKCNQTQNDESCMITLPCECNVYSVM